MPHTVLSFPSVPSDPIEFWQRLHSHPRFGFILGGGASSRIWMSAAEPERLIRSTDSASVLTGLRRLFRSRTKTSPPRWVGWLRFDEGRHFDPGLKRLPLRPDPARMPDSFLGDYSAVVEIDLLRGKTILHSKRNLPAHVRKIQEILTSDMASPTSRMKTGHATFRLPSYGQFKQMVKSAKDAISKGEIYQANLSLRFDAKATLTAPELYRRLWRKNPSPYACLMKAGESWMISNSPELLIRVKGRRVTTRPIAGTRPRGPTKTVDRRRSGQLLLSPKERAEHIMLVDLERNDLGRVCASGSVRVSERYAIERYSHVMHIVSQVEGRLRKGQSSLDALQAVFPGGTITGCPKIKSVEIIERLEGISRGLFYGSAGYFTEGGDAVFNILIRTAYLRGQRLYIQAGAGIVADSHPRREFREILAKSAALREAAGGLGAIRR